MELFSIIPLASAEVSKPSTFQLILSTAYCIATYVALWNIFEKAGIEGWKCLIPFYGTYKEIELACGNGWLFFLLLVPIVNIGFLIYANIQLARAFGKPGLFAVGLIFLAPVFCLILAFDDSAEYIGPKGIPQGA